MRNQWMGRPQRSHLGSQLQLGGEGHPCSLPTVGLVWKVSPDSFGHKMTVKRSHGHCLVCVEEAPINTVI